MQTALIFTPGMTAQQLENSYMLGLALLNFEHSLFVVFVSQAYIDLEEKPKLYKQIMALKNYGIEGFYHYPENHSSPLSIDCGLHQISRREFEDLKNQMDFMI